MEQCECCYQVKPTVRLELASNQRLCDTCRGGYAAGFLLGVIKDLLIVPGNSDYLAARLLRARIQAQEIVKRMGE